MFIIFNRHKWKFIIKKKIGLLLACLFLFLNFYYSGYIYYNNLKTFFINPKADKYDKLKIKWGGYYSLFEKIDKQAQKNNINKILFFNDLRPSVRSRSLTSGFLYPIMTYWVLTPEQCIAKIEEKGMIICKDKKQINIINKLFKIRSITPINWTNIDVNIIEVVRWH